MRLSESAPPLLAALLLSTVALPAAAATTGLPILTSAPGRLSFVNEFGPDLLPTNLFTMSFNGTIATANGAPELVGAPISFSLFASDYGGFYIEPAPSNSFHLAGTNIYQIDGAGDIIPATPPLAGDVDNGDGTWTFTYTAPFAGFGPKVGNFPEVELKFSWTGGFPMKTGYVYGPCADAYGCAGRDFVSEMIVFDPNNPMYLWETHHYIEGAIDDAVITLATVGGRQPSAVPLPAAGWLLGTALLGLGLGVLRRRRG